MRLKNIKGAHEVVTRSSYVINNPFEVIGSYHQIFNNNNPICLEIGMGKGDFIIKKAIDNPHINFIGLEKYDSVIIKAVQKLEQVIIPNLKLISADAIDLDKMFKHEIATIYLNFSDPWPKNRHEDRRLTSLIFLKKYDYIFEKQNEIIMKTDNRHLFEYSIMSFTNYDYRIATLSLNLYEDNISDNVATEYEKKFVEKGNIIYQLKVIKLTVN